jgi:signal transduction histidine kinase/AmiR/NasT family two-component response regulator
LLILAEVHLRLSEYDIASKVLTQVSTIAIEQKLPHHQLMALVSLARLSAYLEEPDQAIYFFTEAEKLARSMGNVPNQMLARAYTSYISLYYKNDISDSNLTRIEQLYQLASRPPIDTLMFLVAGNLYGGALNRIRHDIPKAASVYRRTINLALYQGDLYRVGLVSNNLGEMWVNNGSFDEAEKTLLYSLDIARQVNSRLLKYNCFRLLSKCAESRGDYQLALQYFQSYNEVKEIVLNENLIRQTQQTYALYLLERKAREAERMASEKRLQDLTSEKELRNFRFFSILMVILAFALGYFLFWYKRQLNKTKRQTNVIEEQNKRLQALNRDLTGQRKSAEEARKEAEQAIQSKIDFLSIMSHEIRTPINAVIGTVQLLQEEKPAAHQVKSLEILQFSAENLLNLVNDILDYNRIEAGKVELEKQPFSIRLLLENIRNSLQFKADEKGLALVLKLDRHLPEAFLGDKLRLGQVFYNLVSNALKFTDKGTVEIEVRYSPDATRNIQALIRDTGIGINAENQEKIFDFFSQAEPGISRRFGGSGLGLTITKNLLQIMDSRIELESEPGKGSVFSFALSLQEINASFLPGSEILDPDQESDFSDTRMLFVEDVEYNRIIGERFFSKWSIPFDSASNSAEAVDLASRNFYDIILMDLQLPDRDGFETVQLIRKKGKNAHTPVLAMTASGYDEIAEKLRQSAIDGYVAKPFISQDLKNTLFTWIENGRKNRQARIQRKDL